ncbi:DUF2461 domain-containing protein [uncultured Alistipes sp.]|uniref:DUF2461 domain-containing protein n=1 Tax=uncultured Alistipes sp. TaxID=538949 RepID=UPI0026155815|nr:DUF2461 domain-containing protein [uncultured Alistipes sp.]
MERIIDFMRRLDADNDRAWFDAHRAEWQRVKGDIARLAGRLIEGIAAFDGSVAGLRPQDCTYRIARDTRFSKDKSPYKNWVGVFVCPGGKKSGYAGYYLHISPAEDRLLGGHMLVAGLYCPEPTILRSVRDEVVDCGDELVRNIEAARGFSLDTTNRLKRNPAGFPAGSPHEELLRQKDFCLERAVDEEWLLRPDAVERIVAEFRRTQPFVGQLNRAVRYAYEEMM